MGVFEGKPGNGIRTYTLMWLETVDGISKAILEMDCVFTCDQASFSLVGILSFLNKFEESF